MDFKLIRSRILVTIKNKKMTKLDTCKIEENHSTKKGRKQLPLKPNPLGPSKMK